MSPRQATVDLCRRWTAKTWETIRRQGEEKSRHSDERKKKRRPRPTWVITVFTNMMRKKRSGVLPIKTFLASARRRMPR